MIGLGSDKKIRQYVCIETSKIFYIIWILLVDDICQAHQKPLHGDAYCIMIRQCCLPWTSLAANYIALTMTEPAVTVTVEARL